MSVYDRTEFEEFLQWKKFQEFNEKHKKDNKCTANDKRDAEDPPLFLPRDHQSARAPSPAPAMFSRANALITSMRADPPARLPVTSADVNKAMKRKGYIRFVCRI